MKLVTGKYMFDGTWGAVWLAILDLWRGDKESLAAAIEFAQAAQDPEYQPTPMALAILVSKDLMLPDGTMVSDTRESAVACFAGSGRSLQLRHPVLGDIYV